MRITKRSNIAIRILMYCGMHGDRLVTKSEIAAQCDTSESHLAQVINRLARLGYLQTQRGRGGGIQLERPLPDISVGEIFRQLEETPSSAVYVADADNTNPVADASGLRLALADAVEAFFARLDEVTLDALVQGNNGLVDPIVRPALWQKA